MHLVLCIHSWNLALAGMVSIPPILAGLQGMHSHTSKLLCLDFCRRIGAVPPMLFATVTNPWLWRRGPIPWYVCTGLKPYSMASGLVSQEQDAFSHSTGHSTTGVVMTSDVSGFWGCSAWHSNTWFQLQWDKSSKSLSIAEKVLPILLACLAWGQD